ncbi:hypothetical protein FQR65_LT08789 [Abscondita terminalis]|nr:hypothetical protein FQR65_LT08789 [Abscondita terminalis]
MKMGDTFSSDDPILESYLPKFLNEENQLLDTDESDNGLFLSNTYMPEEVLLHILSYVEAEKLLKYSLVCKKWNSIIKSYSLWSSIYKRKYHRKPKKLPWYLYYCYLSSNYFDTNLLKNGNGEDGYNNWVIKEEGGDKFTIENPPIGSDPLNVDVPEFNNHTSCFATSFGNCYKIQTIKLGQSNLFRYILNNYKPHIYLSEWTAGRFDCGCIYRLRCGFLGLPSNVNVIKPSVGNRVVQWEGSKWKKVDMIIKDYPEGIENLVFEHEGRDTQFWAGHFGSKMAGGVIKILFDSIEPLQMNPAGRKQLRRFKKIDYQYHGEDVSNYFPELLEEPIRNSETVVGMESYLPKFVLRKKSATVIMHYTNGSILNSVQLPDEMIMHILSMVDPKEMLKCRLVCQSWNNKIQSNSLWTRIYKRKYKRTPKNLPWYLYYCLFSTNFFDTNLIKNGNGQEGLMHWNHTDTINNDYFEVEETPILADPLPAGVPDFCNQKSCFVANNCYVVQTITLGKSNLFKYILNNYKPHVYASEWVATSCFCNYNYNFQCSFSGYPISKEAATVSHKVTSRQWKKIEMCISDYPEGVDKIYFEYENCDQHSFQCEHGNKKAGGVLKLLFDSIEPLSMNEYAIRKPKRFRKITFSTNASRVYKKLDINDYLWRPADYFPPAPKEWDVPVLILLGLIPVTLLLFIANILYL